MIQVQMKNEQKQMWASKEIEGCPPETANHPLISCKKMCYFVPSSIINTTL